MRRPVIPLIGGRRRKAYVVEAMGHLRAPKTESLMLHFASYNEFLSEHSKSSHPLAGGLVLILMAVAVLFFF